MKNFIHKKIIYFILLFVIFLQSNLLADVSLDYNVGIGLPFNIEIAGLDFYIFGENVKPFFVKNTQLLQNEQQEKFYSSFAKYKNQFSGIKSRELLLSGEKFHKKIKFNVLS